MNDKTNISRKLNNPKGLLYLSHSSSCGASKLRSDVIPKIMSTSSEKGKKQVKSQPIHFKMKRSDSDIQLQEDLQAAEYRDYCMVRRMQGKHTSRKEKTTPRRSILQHNHNMEYDGIRPRNGKELHGNFETISCISLLQVFEESYMGSQPWKVDSSTRHPVSNIFALIDIDTHDGQYDVNYDDEIFDLEL
jgi:hypothetical protein